MSDLTLAKRALVAKTHRQLNHELPITLYEPIEADKVRLWRDWVELPTVPDEIRSKLGLYLHIPYCKQVCSFCYLEKRLMDRTVPDFVDVLIDEIERLAPLFVDHPLRTVYFGGGTPGALTVAQLERVFRILHDRFDLSHVEEICLESDLPSLSADKLALYARHGVTRLSVGVQNLDDAVLAQNNRLHGFDIEARMALLEAHRFRDLNLDVIVGIPGGTVDSVERTVRRALALRPTKVSVYTFNPYEGYPFDFDSPEAVASLVADRRAQHEVARGLVDAARAEGVLAERDNLQLQDSMRLHAPLLGVGPWANNRLPGRAYYKNPKTGTYLHDPDRLIGWIPASSDEELQIHLFNTLIRQYPIDLRQTRRLFGVAPSQVVARVRGWLRSLIEEGAGDLVLGDDGLLRWTGRDTVPVHLALLANVEITRRHLDRIPYPPHLEGRDVDELLGVMIGY